MVYNLCLGSPPRVRGKGQDMALEVGLVGITPARAGKSEEMASSAPLLRDHPRACGEKVARDPVLDLAAGSPPRVRGKGGG